MLGVRSLSEIVFRCSIPWFDCTYSHQIFTISVSSILDFIIERPWGIIVLYIRGKNKPIIEDLLINNIFLGYNIDK